MSKPWIHTDCLELVTELASMNCVASISDGVMTIGDGSQIDLRGTSDKEWEETRGVEDE